MNTKIVRVLVMGIVGILAFAGSAAAQMDTWQNDAAHSGAYFQVRHLLVSNIRGSFHKMTVTVQYDSKNVAKTSIDATIDATSIDTDVVPRDEDLRGPNYFDVAKFPTLTFKSKRVDSAGAGKMKLVGDLTIHGVTKEVTFDVDGPTAAVEDARKATHMGATATTKINRKDFGITINPVVGDDVSIIMELDLIKKAAPAGSN